MEEAIYIELTEQRKSAAVDAISAWKLKTHVPTITDNKEWPTLKNTVPIETVRSTYKTSRIQKYLHSLDIINNDLHVSTAILVAALALPLFFRRGPSCGTKVV